MNTFSLKISLMNDNVNKIQYYYVLNNINYFISAVKNSLAINTFCTHLEKNELNEYYYLIHYQTENSHNILLNRILEIEENEVLGKYPIDYKNWETIKLNIIN